MSPAPAQMTPPGAMGQTVARQVRTLVRHLDGSQPADPDLLARICRSLDTNAALALDVEDGLRSRPLADALAAAGDTAGARGRRTLR